MVATRKSAMNGDWVEILPPWGEDRERREDHLTVRQSGHRLDIDVRRQRGQLEHDRRRKI
jgi:hypothetical protein